MKTWPMATPNATLADHSASSLRTYTVARCVGVLPAANWSSRNWISYSYFWSQSKNTRSDGCGILKRLLRLLCQPSAMFVVRGPKLSKCDQREGRNSRSHTLSKYSTNDCVLALVTGSTNGGWRSQFHTSGIANTGRTVSDMTCRNHRRKAGLADSSDS